MQCCALWKGRWYLPLFLLCATIFGVQGSWITGVRSLKSKSSIRRCLERCPSERDLSSLDETYEEIKVSVVNNAIEFMKLLNEFGTHVEIQSHLDLRGLTNTAFDDTRTLNGRFSFRSLKGNCSEPLPTHLVKDGPELLEGKPNQCLVILGGSENEGQMSDVDLLLTSIRENPTRGDPLWIDNIYFRATGRTASKATLYAGGGLMMTNVTMQSSGYMPNGITPISAIDVNDYAFHAEGYHCAACVFSDYLGGPIPALICATEGTSCSFRACSFLTCSQSTGSSGGYAIVGSENGATVILQDTKSLPENSSVSVDTGNNLDNAFYTDKMLPVVTDGSIISKTQSLDDIPKRRAETLIDIEDEWFLSLQQALSWADRESIDGVYLYSPTGAPDVQTGPLILGRALDAWTFNFVWLAIATCLLIAAVTICLLRNRPVRKSTNEHRSTKRSPEPTSAEPEQPIGSNEPEQLSPLVGRSFLPFTSSASARVDDENSQASQASWVNWPDGTFLYHSQYDAAPSHTSPVRVEISPSPSGEHVSVRLKPSPQTDKQSSETFGIMSRTLDASDKLPSSASDNYEPKCDRRRTDTWTADANLPTCFSHSIHMLEGGNTYAHSAVSIVQDEEPDRLYNPLSSNPDSARDTTMKLMT